MNTNHTQTPFLRAYIEAALWSSNDESDEQGGESLDRNYSASDIAPDTLQRMADDCAKFQEDNADDLATCTKGDSQAGHDFWLSRNGHGAGFFDAYKGEPYPDDVAARLQEKAYDCGNFDLYIGDDGQIHGS